MANNLELDETVNAWAKIVLDIWEDKIMHFGAHNTFSLINSLYVHVQTAANGNPELVQFFFNFYGKFVDMGVGGGVPIDQVSYSKRKSKPWYSKVFYSQVLILNRILAEKYAHKGSLSIVENVNDNALRWEKSHVKV